MVPLPRWFLATTVVGLVLLSLLAAASPAAASTSRVDRLFYDLALPLADDPECDEFGRSAVRFCDALEEGFNRVTIQVLDYGNPTPVPIGGKYAFYDEAGDVMQEAAFCRQTSVMVPSGATALGVQVADADSYTEGPFGFCGLAPFEGYVRLHWQAVTPAPETPAPPEQEEEEECECVCVCVPPSNCSCECTPKD